MEISVDYIHPHDDKIEARVDFGEDIGGFGWAAHVIVWLPYRDVILSELQNEAIQAAVAFLKDAVAARSE